MSDDDFRCTRCGTTKPPAEFPARKDVSRGHGTRCRTCLAALESERKAAITPEDKAEQAKAYRAGMRKDRCAICKAPQEGSGVCGRCWALVDAMGGLEGLKQAVRAVRYLTGK